MNQPAASYPWDDEQACHWLHESGCWPRLARLAQGTLREDPNTYPHQIRAAAATLVLIARENLWPENSPGILPLTEAVALARRQLTAVKQRYSIQLRQKPDLIGDPVFRALMETLDDEIRILEARIADPPTLLPNRPPSSWREFWSDKFA